MESGFLSVFVHGCGVLLTGWAAAAPFMRPVWRRHILYERPRAEIASCAKNPKNKNVPAGRHVRCAYSRDTTREILSRECASHRRVRGSARNFVKRGIPGDCEVEARPADETAEAEQGQRSAFCKPAVMGAAKTGHRNQGFLTRDCAQKLVPPGAQRYSCKESSGPWSTGVDRMIWVQVLPSFWNCRISCSSCIMLPQLTLIRKVYSPVTW